MNVNYSLKHSQNDYNRSKLNYVVAPLQHIQQPNFVDFRLELFPFQKSQTFGRFSLRK